MTVVADATTLIAFARAERLDLLRELEGQVLIPPAVFDELVVRSAGRPGSEAVRTAAWIARTPVAGPVTLSFPSGLGAGEREAIQLALERSRPLVTDDRAASAFARQAGLHVTWTLALLIVAEERGLVADAEAVARIMSDRGLHLSAEVVARFGEALRESRAGRGPAR